MSVRRRTVLGVPLDNCSSTQIVATIESWVDTHQQEIAVGVNAHVVNLAASNPDFAKLLGGSGLSYADGQSVVWASSLLGHPVPERSATTDLIYPIAQLAARRGFPVFLLGGAPGIAQQAADRLAGLNPGLRIAARHGYFSDAENSSVIAEINDFGTQILFVGLGDPLQQEWSHANRPELTAPAVLTCGGLFDWVAGTRRRAPTWLARIGLEWLWRLLLEPRRLWRRYVLGNPRFLYRVIREMLST